MSRFADLTAPIRQAPEYLPPCPLCSHIGHQEFPDIITGPSSIRSRTSGKFGLLKCCQMSEGAGWHETEAQAALWWREKRQQPHPDLATDNRRRNSLSKLTSANLDPL